MKKSIIYLLFFFAVYAFSPNIVFAQSAMTGSISYWSVDMAGNYDNIIKHTTVNNGKFSFNVKEGEYMLNFSYEELIKFEINNHRPGDDAITNKESYEFTVKLDEKSVLLLKDSEKRRQYQPMVIRKRLDKATPLFSVPKGGRVISGTLTFVKLNEQKR